MLRKKRNFLILAVLLTLLLGVNLSVHAFSSGPPEKEGPQEIPEGHVRIHYHRFDGDYSGWGLHVWGDGYDGPEVSWSSPLSPVAKNDFGIYWDIPYKGSGKLNYIIHKGDNKDVSADQSIPNPGENNEVWIVSGDDTEYLSKDAAKGALKNKFETAVIKNKNTIVVDLRTPIDKGSLKIMTDGEEVAVKSVVALDGLGEYAVSIEDEIEYSKSYTAKTGDLERRLVLNPDLLDKAYNYSGELGALYSPQETTFKVWAPVATNVELLLFNEDKQKAKQEPDKRIKMKSGEEGVWEVTVSGDLAGQYYQYAITNQGETKRALDPYAKSMGGTNSTKEPVEKAAVVDLDKTNPQGWQSDDYVKVKDQENVVIYEMSVRDFTIAPNSGVSEEKKGLYEGFIEKIPHLKELGITHVQLMPVLNWYYGNEFEKSFEERTHKGEANYNWGYDPHNYFTPEGWYSKDPANPHLRIKELKKLIKALHDNDIGVMLDVVYNHTAQTFVFNNLVPKYYYRYKENGRISNGSGCGNTTESRRKMMRKLIVDSTTYWVDEYHVDGFRFDLMGLHDEATMMKVNEEVKKINPDAVIHGEGWNMPDIGDEAAYVKGQGDRSLLKYEHAPGVFSDSIRDSIIQPSAFASAEKGAFIQGVEGSDAKLRAGIIGGMVDFETDAEIVEEEYDRFSDDPEETTTYVTCHDGRTQWDKISVSAADASAEEKKRMHKLSSAIILTSQGRAFLHGGVEMARTKPDSDREHGIAHNSYDSGDSVNMIDWSRKDKYSNIFEYHKGLIKLRKNHEAFRMETMEEIQKGITFYNIKKDNLVAYKLQEQDGDESWGDIVVIYNANRTAQEVEIPEVNSNWKVVVDGEKAGVKELKDTEVEISQGSVKVPAISAVVLHN